MDKKLTWLCIGLMLASGISYAMDTEESNAMDLQESKKRTLDEAQQTDYIPKCPLIARKRPKSRRVTEDYSAQDASSVVIQFQRDVGYMHEVGGGAWVPLNAVWRLLPGYVATDNLVKTRSMLNVYPHIMNKRDAWGNTLLHDAVLANKIWYIRLLCERGMCVYEPNNEQQTPLSLAQRTNNAQALAILQRYDMRGTFD